MALRFLVLAVAIAFSSALQAGGPAPRLKSRRDMLLRPYRMAATPPEEPTPNGAGEPLAPETIASAAKAAGGPGAAPAGASSNEHAFWLMATGPCAPAPTRRMPPLIFPGTSAAVHGSHL